MSTAVLEDELDEELELEEELELLLDELELMLDVLELLEDELELLDELLEAKSQTLPVTSGISAALPGTPFSAWKPNDTTCPGSMLLFQLKGDAV
jgi:hypothetical protein